MAELVTDKREKAMAGLLKSLSELVGLKVHVLRGKRQTPKLDSSRIRVAFRGKMDRKNGQGNFFANLLRFIGMGQRGVLSEVENKDQGQKNATKQKERRNLGLACILGILASQETENLLGHCDGGWGY